MASSFWFEDLPNNPEEKISKISDLIKYASESDLTVGKEIDLMGKIHLPMFEQTKALLCGTNIRLKFIPNDPSFYIMKDADVRLQSVEFTDCALFIHKSKIASRIRDGHAIALEKANARYHLRESFVVPVTNQ